MRCSLLGVSGGRISIALCSILLNQYCAIGRTEHFPERRTMWSNRYHAFFFENRRRFPIVIISVLTRELMKSLRSDMHFHSYVLDVMAFAFASLRISAFPFASFNGHKWSFHHRPYHLANGYYIVVVVIISRSFILIDVFCTGRMNPCRNRNTSILGIN